MISERTRAHRSRTPRSRTACSGSKAASSSSSSPRTSARRRSTRSRAPRSQRFAEFDPIEAYADLLAFASGFGAAHHQRRPTAPWQPTRINLGSGKDYKSGWLNIDILDRAEPDLVLDLAGALSWPHEARGDNVGPVRLEAGSVALINANNVLEHVPDLPTLMTNALALLKTGGEFHIEVPYEKRAHRLAGPDPRAGDERELLDLLHRLVLVPRLVRAPLRDRELDLPRHAS